MNSKDRIISTLSHRQTDKVAIDFGATATSGIHVLAVERLRGFYGLDRHPVKVIEPYQMLGEVETDLQEVLGVDVIGAWGKNNIFGFANENWKGIKTFWGQEVLVPGNFNTKTDEKGDLLIFPQGDIMVPASAKMPKSSYFFDAIIRQQPINDKELNPEDNLEEFVYISDEELKYWEMLIESANKSGKGIIGNFGGTSLGDIALVPGLDMKYPKGIRDVAEWYMSIIMRADYVHAVFAKQTDIALSNLKKIYNVVGNRVEAVEICGNDFGTQDSLFCSPETFEELYAPYYRKMNDWVHKNTTWKTFKHSCGAIVPLLNNFIDSGFDILNPVQINADGMDPKFLKENFGDRIVFWGGGVDTQKTLAFGSPSDVEKQVLSTCEIFSKNGGFVFNTVHNIQANVPVENIAAIIRALKIFNRN
jgi:Uroporphyrinogen decarboxylase (URO-D)